MPMPALTTNNSQFVIPLKEGLKKELKKSTIGSFRNNADLKTLLPHDIFSSLFDPIPDNLDVRKLITIPNSNGKHYLNNAAFGRRLLPPPSPPWPTGRPVWARAARCRPWTPPPSPRARPASGPWRTRVRSATTFSPKPMQWVADLLDILGFFHFV